MACISGGLLLGFGVLGVLCPSDAETCFHEYSSLPQEKEEERTEKIRQGEKMLKDLSLEGTLGRIVVGTTLLIGGAAQIAGWIAQGVGGSLDYSRPDLWPFFGLTAACLGGGLMNLLFPSLAEREWKSYQSWKSREASAFRSDSAFLDLAIAPEGVEAHLSLKLRLSRNLSLPNRPP